MTSTVIVFVTILSLVSLTACQTISDYCLKYEPVPTLECAGEGCSQEQQDGVDYNNAVYYEHCL